MEKGLKKVEESVGVIYPTSIVKEAGGQFISVRESLIS
jgi:hypothetical protein